MDTTYSKFALVYDNLMDNIPYDEWTSYLKKLLDDYDIKEGIIESVKKFIKKGKLSYDEIADNFDIPVEEVRRLAAQMS